jgi:hypothetical protein
MLNEGVALTLIFDVIGLTLSKFSNCKLSELMNSTEQIFIEAPVIVTDQIKLTMFPTSHRKLKRLM